MEELRSTEILDKEIKEDARKKAERILKNADSEAASIASGVPLRIKTVKKEKEIFYSEQIAAYKNDAEAAVPLEKLRKEISYIDSEIKKALSSYFEKIGKDGRLKIIRTFLYAFQPFIQNTPVKVRYAGYSNDEIKMFIEKNFSGFRVREYKALSSAESELTGLKDGIFIEDCDETFICRASIDEAENRLLNEKRAELKHALFGGN